MGLICEGQTTFLEIENKTGNEKEEKKKSPGEKKKMEEKVKKKGQDKQPRSKEQRKKTLLYGNGHLKRHGEKQHRPSLTYVGTVRCIFKSKRCGSVNGGCTSTVVTVKCLTVVQGHGGKRFSGFSV